MHGKSILYYRIYFGRKTTLSFNIRDSVTFFSREASLPVSQEQPQSGPSGDIRMRSCRKRFYLLAVLSLLALSGWPPRGHPDQGAGGVEMPRKGFGVERIEQKRTETISWLRVQILADTGTEETWAALQNIEEWDEFLRIFPRITPVARTETMTRYRMAVSPPWPIRDFDSLIWVATLPELRLMLWRADKDDLARSHGRIEVEEIAGGTRVSYEIHSPVKNAFPPWVVRIGLRLVLPGIAKDFYERINESGE
jgi:hypothetical protein